jgi:quercetin dioxygenase-like cupin family protein
MVSRNDPELAKEWSFADLISQLSSTLQTGSSVGQCRWVENRVLGVLATPELRNASRLAVGVSGLPAGVRTIEHDHEAEELAIVLAGQGEIVIDGQSHEVRPGSIVLAPSFSRHTTQAHAGNPLLVLWIYAPPGSERKWLGKAATRAESKEGE